MSAEDPAGQFNDLLIQAAEKTIPKTLFNHLPNSALSVLLKVYNHVWKSGHRGAKRWFFLFLNPANRVEGAVQMCLDSVQDCVSENGFKFSASQTVCIHFHQQFGFFPDHIFLGKTPKKEAKFLGLIFDTKLTFKNHVQHLKFSCQKALHILRVGEPIVSSCYACTVLRLSAPNWITSALCTARLVGCLEIGNWIRSTIRAYVSRWELFALLLPTVSTWRHANRPWLLVV